MNNRKSEINEIGWASGSPGTEVTSFFFLFFSYIFLVFFFLDFLYFFQIFWIFFEIFILENTKNRRVNRSSQHSIGQHGSTSQFWFAYKYLFLDFFLVSFFSLSMWSSLSTNPVFGWTSIENFKWRRR